MGRSIATAILFSLMAMQVSAQKKQVIYFKNGNKAIEGNWKIVYSRMETPSLIEALLIGESQSSSNTHIAPKQIHSSDNSYRNRILQFEGLCTIYYTTGKARQKATYEHGILQGPFEYYDVDGLLSAKGNYKDGMPNGHWQYFDQGKKYLEATYRAYTQTELDSLFLNGPRTPEAAPVNNFNDYYSLTKTLSKATDDYFREYRSVLPGNTRPEGEIIYYNKEGEKEVLSHYKNGYRNGDWIRYEGKIERLKAVYRNNELAELYDVNKKDVLKDTVNVAGKDYTYLFGKHVVIPTPSKQEGDINGIDPGIPVVAAPPESLMDNAVFKYVEQMPEFSGDINQYLQKHIVYPKSGGEGRVYLQFVVKADGSVSDVQLLRGIDEACNAEAIRVVSGMPKWKPGRQNGRAVNVSFSLPVSFKRQ